MRAVPVVLHPQLQLHLQQDTLHTGQAVQMKSQALKVIKVLVFFKTCSPNQPALAVLMNRPCLQPRGSRIAVQISSSCASPAGPAIVANDQTALRAMLGGQSTHSDACVVLSTSNIVALLQTAGEGSRLSVRICRQNADVSAFCAR